MKKKVKVDVYNRSVTLYVLPFKKWATELPKDVYSVTNGKQYKGLTMINNLGDCSIILDTLDYSVLVHEIYHVVSFMMRHIGKEPDWNDDEPCAYLADFLFRKFHKWMEDNKVELKYKFDKQ